MNLSAYSSAALRFNQYFKGYEGSSATLSYSINSGTSWTSLASLTATSATNPEVFNQVIAAAAGQSTVQFKWNYTGDYGFYWVIDDVTVFEPPSHDVAALSVDLAAVHTTAAFAPQASVKNLGANTETFPVTMTIGAYTSTKTVDALASGDARQVTFDPWTAAMGTYTVEVCTQLAGDLNTGNDCLLQGVKVMDLNKQVYGYNAFTGSGTDPVGPAAFNLSDPGNLHSLADQSTMNFVAGGTWAAGAWYGTVYNTAAPFDFITIDPATGARTVIGTQTAGINGLSYNTANSTLYGVDFDGTNSNLYSVNLTTGATTFIGSCGAILLINLAINDAGQAFAVDIGTDILGSVNLTTGAFTSIGPIGFDDWYAQDMEFDRETGELYMAAQDASSGWLAWVNQATGATCKIGDFEGGAEVTGLAIPYAVAAPAAYAVTGTGFYCEGTGGLPAGVANSEPGVTYTLFKDGAAQAPTVAGTGAAIGFGSQTAGTYTVSGTNGKGTAAMTGSAVITENPLPAAAGPITGPAAFDPGTAGIAYSVDEIAGAASYIWAYSGTGVTITGTGTGVTLDFSVAATPGQLSVYGNNTCGDGAASFMDITMNPRLLNVKVFLEGAFNAGTGVMNNTLQANSVLEPAQPYGAAPWMYAGPEQVAGKAAIPAGVVDWVLVELRDAAAPEEALPGTKLAGWPRAFFLKTDGSIVDLNGTSLKSALLKPGYVSCVPR